MPRAPSRVEEQPRYPGFGRVRRPVRLYSPVASRIVGRGRRTGDRVALRRRRSNRRTWRRRRPPRRRGRPAPAGDLGVDTKPCRRRRHIALVGMVAYSLTGDRARWKGDLVPRSMTRGRTGKVVMAASVLAASLVAVTAGAAAEAADCVGVPNDINGDGFADLVVGTPWFRDGVARFQGAIEVTYGSGGGFSDDSPLQEVHRASPPAKFPGGRSLESTRPPATSMTTGRRHHHRRTSPSPSPTCSPAGSPSGVDVGAARWIQSSEVIPALSADSLGESLAVGDFDNDGFDDVAAGAPDWPTVDSPYGGVAVLLWFRRRPCRVVGSLPLSGHPWRPGSA